MTSYFYVGSSERGKLGISTYVFQQIAESALSDLVNGELKDSLVLKDGKKTGKVSAVLDKKGNLLVSMEVIAFRGSDVAGSIALLQKEVYEDIYDTCEISNLKVNVSVLAVIDKKA
jgi:uncharacterized alkaline shock family protein YloU